MRNALLFVMIILILCAGMVFAQEITYRVSGVVGRENSWLFAVIEDSRGNCSMYTPGAMLGNGRIIEITSQGVQVDFSSDVRFLTLEGSAFIAPAGPPEIPNSASAPLLVSGSLPADELKNTISTMAAELERDRKKVLDPQVLNAILNLPSTARIATIEGKAVTTPSDVVSTLKNAFVLNRPIRITFNDGEETSNIYLMMQNPDSSLSQ